MSYTTFELNIDEDVLERLESLAEDEGITVDELIEQVLTDYVSSCPMLEDDEDDIDDDVDVDDYGDDDY